MLIVGLWVGPGSYPELWKIENKKVLQEQANTQKKEQIRKIKAELDDAASGQDALEERARELGMTKKGETFFEVVLQPEKKSQPKKKTSMENKNLDTDTTVTNPVNDKNPETND